jgi:hypothetical protein
MNCLEQPALENRLSQGDVIVWPVQPDFMNKAAVVVTADCDFAKGKHWGKVTVVPLIPAPAYFDQFFLPKQLENMENDLLVMFGSAVQISMGATGDAPPTPQVLETLLGLDTLPDSIPSPSNASKLHTVIRQGRGIVSKLSAAEALDQALLLRNNKTKSLSADKIKVFLDSPPGDCMILPSIPGLETGIHIAYLRIMRELRDEDIALKTSQADEGKGQRIGRLVPVVRYHLTQRLAQVFSDIGLPDSYEAGLKTDKNSFLTMLTQPKEGA